MNIVEIRRSRAAKQIEHDAVAARDILDGVGHKSDRFDGRMQGKLIHPSGLEAVGSLVVPDIGPITAMLTKLEAVDVRC